ALDPAKAMFWTWNSGYIMAKLEGNSPLSSQPNNKFEYHIGGFSGADNVLKQVTLSFPLGQAVTLQPNRSSEMTITANANTWFVGPNPLQISTNAVCTTPGPLAKQISDNYAGMFTVTGIVN
ncbi:MAG TPA: MbnP family protein, partial [Chitinophagaceae bacterium]|nr:MbnP family protein [Chitinophagaceae bacterium]